MLRKAFLAFKFNWRKALWLHAYFLLLIILEISNLRLIIKIINKIKYMK